MNGGSVGIPFARWGSGNVLLWASIRIQGVQISDMLQLGSIFGVFAVRPMQRAAKPLINDQSIDGPNGQQRPLTNLGCAGMLEWELCEHAWRSDELLTSRLTSCRSKVSRFQGGAPQLLGGERRLVEGQEKDKRWTLRAPRATRPRKQPECPNRHQNLQQKHLSGPAPAALQCTPGTSRRQARSPCHDGMLSSFLLLLPHPGLSTAAMARRESSWPEPPILGLLGASRAPVHEPHRHAPDSMNLTVCSTGDSAQNSPRQPQERSNEGPARQDAARPQRG